MCEEWWEITHDNNLNYLDRLFKDDVVRRTVRQALLLEIVAITLCYSLTSERSTQLTVQRPALLSVPALTCLKNLMFYSHQNFLTLIEIIIHRLPPESTGNIWAHSLQAILLNKSSK
jgi:hypothetical protein